MRAPRKTPSRESGEGEVVGVFATALFVAWGIVCIVAASGMLQPRDLDGPKFCCAGERDAERAEPFPLHPPVDSSAPTFGAAWPIPGFWGGR